MGTCTSIGVLLTALAFQPTEAAVFDKVDLVEINHFHDDQGRLVFDQLIFYDWCSVQCRFNVRAWRLLKTPAQVPTRDWKTGDYRACWHDGTTLRKVRAGAMRESWTQYDPELVEREFLAKEKRRDLLKQSESPTR